LSLYFQHKFEEQQMLPRAEIRLLMLALWVLLTAIGWGAYTYIITLSAWSSIEAGLRVGLSGGIIIGLVVGVSQALLLRAFVVGAIRWVLPTFIGWTLGGTLGGVLFSIMYADDAYDFSLAVKGVIVGAVVGAVIGVCQWVTLRVWVRGAHRWIIATIIGCSIGAPFGWVVGFMLSWPFVQLLGEAGWPYYVELAIISGSLASGAVLGIVTSFTLKILLGSSQKNEEAEFANTP
jgi:hypothetical protein